MLFIAEVICEDIEIDLMLVIVSCRAKMLSWQEVDEA